MVFTSVILIIITITGIILIHEHDTTFFSRTRVPAYLLPDRYQHKLDNMRRSQGVTTQFSKDRDTVPLSWLIYDLHSGEIFGKYGWVYYDILSVALLVYTGTGIYMFLYLTRKKGRKKK
jgi:uncharacterized iron-regulated membrane protein